MKFKIILLFFIFILVGCVNNNSNDGQELKTGLPFDKKTKNIAALFTMTDEGGRIENLNLMESIFNDGSLGFICERHHNKPSNYIYNRVTELTNEIGPEGTLLLYLNSHGGGSGSRFGMTSSDGSFKFSKTLNAITKGKKVKRLIVLIDTCHASGGIQEAFDGKEKLIPNSKTGLIELPDQPNEFFNKNNNNNNEELFDVVKTKFYYGENSGAYDEALIIASSSAADLSMRGAFASRLKKAFDEVKDKKEITVGSFLTKFSSLHHNTGQKPHYKILPNENLLNEPLFYNLPLRDIPIVDHQKENKGNVYPKDYIPLPQN